MRRPAVVLCTGAGKTVIFTSLASHMIRTRGARPLILVHKEELVHQTVAKLRDADPGLSVGVIQAERHEPNADVVVASVATLHRRLGTGPKGVAASRFNLIIVDEVHHVVAATYLKILEHFGAMDPESDTLFLGVTATPGRSDKLGLGKVIEEIVYEYDTVTAIREGYLVPVTGHRAVMSDLDLAHTKTTAGDWSAGDLGGQLIRSGARIAEKYLELGRDEDGQLRRAICFAPTVECADIWAEDFRELGIRTECVFGTTSTEDRQRIYKAIAAGDLDCLMNVMVGTEGFDCPPIEVCIIGRPTKSVPLYTQVVGRVLRPSPSTGKTSALLIDVCGTMNDALVTIADLGDVQKISREVRELLVKDDPLFAPPPLPVEIDDSEIELQQVDLFVDGPPRPKRRTSGWMVTANRSIPFLPPVPSVDFMDTVFLFPEEGAWTVGVAPKQGRVTRVATGLTLAEAKTAAEDLHPSRGRPQPKLSGEASTAQRQFLDKLGVSYDTESITKNDAADLITVALATRQLEGA